MYVFMGSEGSWGFEGWRGRMRENEWTVATSKIVACDVM